MRNKTEYAIKIYNKVFGVKVDIDNFDCNVKAVLDALKILTEQERFVLESQYCYGDTLREIADEIDVTSIERPRQIEEKAFRKLRNPTVMRYMSISGIEKERDYYKESHSKALAEINSLKEYIEKLDKNLPKPPENVDLTLNIQSTINYLDLSVRSYNCLKRAGKHTVGDILNTENADDLRTIRDFGKKSFEELIEKMEKHGFTDWAEKMKIIY